MNLNIIVGNHTDRHPYLMKELAEQNIHDYKLWPGVYLRHSVKASINAAHKQIVLDAYSKGLNKVCIAEDDLKFSSSGSWEYFMENMPIDFDMYLSMVYLGELDQNNCVKDFTGMTLYVVHQRFYETFLSVPDEEHIDRALAGLGKYVVCNPFVALQYNGVSSNTGKYEEYDDLLKNRRFL